MMMIVIMIMMMIVMTFMVINDDNYDDDHHQVTILDKREDGDEGDESIRMVPQVTRLSAVEDFSASDSSSLGCALPAWRSFRHSIGNCLKQGNPGSGSNSEVLVEVKQVLHPICSSLRHVDITDTSITNVGLQQLCRKMKSLTSLGEYSISDSFLRSLCVVSSLKMDKFPLVTLHSRKVSYTGMYNLVHVFSNIRSLTCWEPLFDIADLAYLPHLKQITLIRIRYSDSMLSSIIHYFEDCRGAKNLEKVCLEFIVHEQAFPVVYVPEFDVSKIFHNCDKLKVFTIEFKDSLQATPSVGYSSYNIPREVGHVFVINMLSVVLNLLSTGEPPMLPVPVPRSIRPDGPEQRRVGRSSKLSTGS